MKAGHILAISNQKGGVGKTTTSINLAASLVATKRKVLLVDLDPQGNTTSGVGEEKNSFDRTIYDVLMNECSVGEAIVKTSPVKLDLLPANGDLTAAEVELLSELARESRLKVALDKIKHNYDYVIIDCPPSLNMLTVNVMVSADSVLIPMQCEYYALEGLASLISTVDNVRKILNPGLHISGILRTMYDPRNSLSNDVSSQLTSHFGDTVFRTIIPRNVRLAEAPSHGLPVLQYDKRSRGALGYLALAGELIRRDEKKGASDDNPRQKSVEATE